MEAELYYGGHYIYAEGETATTTNNLHFLSNTTKHVKSIFVERQKSSTITTKVYFSTKI